MMPYERLKAWQHCHRLALHIYSVSKVFPVSERFGITAQIRRAAFSAPANIVEGAAKRGPKEFRRFLDIAGGSLVELSYWLRVAGELGFMDRETFDRLDAEREVAGRVTWGLYRTMAARVRPVSRIDG